MEDQQSTNESTKSFPLLDRNHPHFSTAPNLTSELSSSLPSSPAPNRVSEDFKFIGDTRKRAPSKGVRSTSPSKGFFKAVRRNMSSDEVAPPLSKPILDRSKSETVIKKFTLNQAEVLVDDFSAALLKQILLHGRLYLTQNFLCFESKIFGSKTAEVIPLNEIIVLKKKSRKLKLHVGIEISTASHTYHFASFVSRDKAFAIIHEAWGKSAPEKAQAQVQADSSGGDEWDDEDNEISTSQNDSYLSASEDDVSIFEKHENYVVESEAMLSDSSERSSSRSISASECVKRKLSDPSKSGNESQVKSHPSSPHTSPNFKPSHNRSSSTPVNPLLFSISASTSSNITNNNNNNGNIANSSNSINGNSSHTNNNTNNANTIPQEHQKETTLSQTNNNTTNHFHAENNNHTNHNSNNINNNNNNNLSQTTTVTPPPQNNPIDDLVFDEQNYSDLGFLGPSPFQMILSESFEVSVTSFFKIFFSDKSTFTSRYHVQRGDQDFSVKKWAKNQQFGTMREILYSAKVNAPLGPDRTRVQEIQRCHLQKEKFVIESVGVMSDIPYGDCFKVESKWEVCSTGNNGSRLTINLAVNFIKKTWFKGKIESQTIKETTESFKQWMALAKVELQNPEALKALLQPQVQEQITTTTTTITTTTNTQQQQQQQSEIPRNLSSNSLGSSGPSDISSPSLMRRNPSWNSLQNQNAPSSSAKPRRKKSASSNLSDNSNPLSQSNSQIPVIQTSSLNSQPQTSSSLAFAPPPANLPSKSIISRVNDIISASEQLDLKTIFIIVLFFVCMNLYMRLQYIEGKLDLLESLVKLNLQHN